MYRLDSQTEFLSTQSTKTKEMKTRSWFARWAVIGLSQRWKAVLEVVMGSNFEGRKVSSNLGSINVQNYDIAQDIIGDCGPQFLVCIMIVNNSCEHQMS